MDLIVVEIKAKMADLVAVFNLAKMNGLVIVKIMDLIVVVIVENMANLAAVFNLCKNKRFDDCG